MRGERVGGDQRDEISESKRSSGPVPGTVEIASEHEIATFAAVPGTDMVGLPGGRGICNLQSVIRNSQFAI